MWMALLRNAWLGRLWRCQRGSIAVLGVLSLSSVLAMSGLAVEMGTGYATKVRNQRVADMAALGAAVAYAGASQSITAAQATASDIVVANGLPSSAATVSQTTVGTQSAIKVQISTTVPIALARVVAGTGSYTVANTAYAALNGSGAMACIMALSTSSTSVSATGGAGISASGCSIVSNGTLYSDNGSAKITAKQITGAAINDSQNAITTTPTANNIKTQSNAAVDSVKASNAQVQQALCLVNQLTGYSDPDYPGGNRNCTTQLVTVSALADNGSTTDWSSNWSAKTSNGFNQYTNGSCNYTIPPGNYVVRDISIAGGCTITFQGPFTLSARSVNMAGDTMTMGNGDVTMSGTFTVNANNTITIGNGNHSFGTLTINGGKSLTLGSGSFYVVSSISLSGGAFMKANVSAGDTVTIGASSGTSVSVGGGSQLCFTSDCSAPTAAAGKFSAAGTVSNTGGGSTIVFPKSQIHVINGDLTLAAAAIFGPGLYVIAGKWTNGTGCSGCTMQGTDITFALGGTFSFGGGTSFDLAAPTSSTGSLKADGTLDTGYGIQDILLITKSSSGTAISAGSTGKAAGMIYAPNSAFSSSGGSAISSNGSACMMLIANTISVSGSGTVNTKNCASQTSSSGGTASLLQ